MTDLEEAIRIRQEAVNITPQDHPNWAQFLDNLRKGFYDRHIRTGVITDLEKTIQVQREAVNITPQDDPHRAGYLNNLRIGLNSRYL